MKMNYVVLGANDLSRAVVFYESVFAGSGMSVIHADGRMTVWSGDDFMFAVTKPLDGGAASNGNGTMVGFNLGSAR